MIWDGRVILSQNRADMSFPKKFMIEGICGIVDRERNGKYFLQSRINIIEFSLIYLNYIEHQGSYKYIVQFHIVVGKNILKT